MELDVQEDSRRSKNISYDLTNIMSKIKTKSEATFFCQSNSN